MIKGEIIWIGQHQAPLCLKQLLLHSMLLSVFRVIICCIGRRCPRADQGGLHTQREVAAWRAPLERVCSGLTLPRQSIYTRRIIRKAFKGVVLIPSHLVMVLQASGVCC